MAKKIVRLNERQLRRMIAESVRRIIKESSSSAYDYIDGKDLVENVFWKLVPESMSYDEGKRKIASMIASLNDPAIDELMDKEYTVYGEINYEESESYLTDDGGLEDTINKVRNPKLRAALMKEYDYYTKKLDFKDPDAEERDWADAERAESDYDW